MKLRYEVPSYDPSGNLRKLSAMFGVIESVKASLFIEDYSISQTSLEQVRPMQSPPSVRRHIA